MSTLHPSVVVGSAEKLPDSVQAFRLVLALAQELRTLMDQRLAPSGLTTQQAGLLTVIDVLGGRPMMSEAARALAMTHQNVKQLATALERKRMLEIVADERDARSKRMVTTDRHKAFWAERNPDDHACVAQWLSGLAGNEAATLARLLAKAMQSARATRTAVAPQVKAGRQDAGAKTDPQPGRPARSRRSRPRVAAP